MKLEKDDRMEEEIQILKKMVFLVHEADKKQKSINDGLIGYIEGLTERINQQDAEIARLKKRWWKTF